MMYDPMGWSARGQRHLKGLEYQLGSQMRRRCPTDDAPGEHVQYHRQEQGSAPRG
jgi:hypothetical protein